MKPIDDYDLRPEKPVVSRLSPAAERLLCVAVAVALLIPCFWQPHILGGDIPNHLYNAWLTRQVKDGQIPGLIVNARSTNVLTDWALEFLLKAAGRVWAERLVVGAAVEMFFWGAFCFAASVAGKRCWLVAPSLALLTYGLIFHMGFLNFYVATGLSVWMLAVLWNPGGRWRWLALPLGGLALLAHVMPLAWAAAVWSYVWILRRLSPQFRLVAFAAAVGILLVTQRVLVGNFGSVWTWFAQGWLEGSLGLSGAEQLWLWGHKYLIPAAALLLIWILLLAERLRRPGFLIDPAAHLWMLNVAGFLLLPGGIHASQYNQPLLFISQRISLFVGVSFCALVAGAPNGRMLARASCLVAAVFFTALYFDQQAMNRVEREVATALENVPQGARVTLSLEDANSPRLNGVLHLADALCIERCFVYANFEAATRHFRLEVTQPNTAAKDDMQAVQEMENGTYIVQPVDAPLYSLCAGEGPADAFEFRMRKAGETVCKVTAPVTLDF